MKKFLFILCFFFAVNVFAQNPDPLPREGYSITETILRAIIQNTIKAMRVYVHSGTISLDSTALAKFDSLMAGLDKSRDSSNSKWLQWFDKHWATYERQDSIIKHLSDQIILQQEQIDSLNVLKNKVSSEAKQDSIRLDLANALARADSIIQRLSSQLLKQQENIDTLQAQHSTLTSIKNFLSGDSLSVKDILNIKSLLTQILAKQEYPDSTTVVNMAALKSLLTQILAKQEYPDSTTVVNMLDLKSLLTQILAKQEYPDSTTVVNMLDLKSLLTQILAKQEYPDSTTVVNMLDLKSLLTQIFVKDTTIAEFLSGAINYYTNTDTISVDRVDSLDCAAAMVWIVGDIVTDSTLVISWDKDFTAGFNAIITTASFPVPIKKWDATIGKKLYIKKYSGLTGAARFYVNLASK